MLLLSIRESFGKDKGKKGSAWGRGKEEQRKSKGSAKEVLGENKNKENFFVTNIFRNFAPGMRKHVKYGSSKEG